MGEPQSTLWGMSQAECSVLTLLPPSDLQSGFPCNRKPEGTEAPDAAHTDHPPKVARKGLQRGKLKIASMQRNASKGLTVGQTHKEESDEDPANGPVLDRDCGVTASPQHSHLLLFRHQLYGWTPGTHLSGQGPLWVEGWAPRSQERRHDVVT